ncbi:uncharacterized protein EDB93DRAFT_1115890 [Suillus bovinus]|uniref:uncharacterized protein n=1 Tax=Suillus bovinus TaxID=48563 RepID=UPI001B86C93C|nr:uncharacterized protein EDB93DRAFT_1115890 [Suillus bovinus]KAG2159471.1 hypothetical protein EDB93DRAFT_1115890 [Suillus bovinus]
MHSFIETSLTRPWTTCSAMIHRLPVEILQAIFLLAVDNGPDCPSIFSYEATTISANFASPPLLFTRVCHHWRDVARSTPEIWSRIEVKLPPVSVKPLTPFFTSLLQFWLAQSDNLPLTIHMASNYSSWDGNSRLLEILCNETRRWETVIGFAPAFDSSDNFNTPQLRTLDPIWDLSNLTKFNAPKLCRVRICSLYDNILSLRPNAACGNIRHLCLHQTSVNRIHYFPDIFPRLETLDVRLLQIAPDYVLDMENHSDTYSCLESMTLPFVHGPPDMYAMIFRGHHFPALQELILLVGAGKPEVEMITEALAVAGSCNIRVVDFWLHKSRMDLYVPTLKQLLSVAQEVAVRGEVVVRREQSGP